MSFKDRHTFHPFVSLQMEPDSLQRELKETRKVGMEMVFGTLKIKGFLGHKCLEQPHYHV
jgi:hypothetical protein